MAKILIIDTAVTVAGICLANGTEILAQESNATLKEQAGWLQPAIKTLFERAGLAISAIDAVAVSAGPGSYTGLRVSMSSAKGLCYALSKPLICMNTLKIMAIAAIRQSLPDSLFCPMIDARRMEVFTALYDNQLIELVSPQSMVLEAESFTPWLLKTPVIFFGNGAKKYKDLLKIPAAIFPEIKVEAADGIGLAAEMYARKEFSDLAYAEPFYLKPFYTP